MTSHSKYGTYIAYDASEATLLLLSSLQKNKYPDAQYGNSLEQYVDDSLPYIRQKILVGTYILQEKENDWSRAKKAKRRFFCYPVVHLYA